MNLKMKACAALALAVVIASAQAQTATTTKTKKKHPAAAMGPSVESQIQSLRKDLEGQIGTLKQEVADRDAKLAAAQQAAADAQAAAAKAQAAADAQSAAVSQNTAATTDLKATVDDLKGNQTSILGTIQDEQKKVTAAIEAPSALHYKGITLTPGGFLAAETVWRQKATGADIPTAFSSLPFNGANSADLSEFYGTGRQSRISLMAEGKTKSATYRGYVEADFLGTGTSSNNNQSNSYVMRQRVAWAEAAFKNGVSIQGGQMWSLAAERAKGLSNFSGDVKTPQTIDPNYVPGFVWARQYGFRVTDTFKHVAYGVSIENSQVLTGNSCPTATAGSPATAIYASCLIGGGSDPIQYISGTSSPSSTSGSGVQGSSYNNFSGTYSYNLGPDLIGKVAVDPGWGHYEVYGIGRFPHYEVYPNYTTGSVAGKFTDSLAMGGIGGSLRAPVLGKYGDFGFAGLWGYGVGRYGDTTLADVIFDANGRMKALENVSALSTLELKPTPRLVVYLNYGLDFAGRLVPHAGGSFAYGLNTANNSGCNVESSPSQGQTDPSSSPANCKGNTRNVQEFTAGFWYDFYKGAAGRIRYGVQYSYAMRDLWYGVTSGVAYNPQATENMIHTSFRYYLP